MSWSVVNRNIQLQKTRQFVCVGLKKSSNAMSTTCNAGLLHFCNHNHKFPFKCEAAAGSIQPPLQPQPPSRPQRRPTAGNQLGLLPRPIFQPPVFVTSHPVPSLFPATSDPAVIWLPRPFLASTSSKFPQLMWTWVPIVVALPFSAGPPLIAYRQAQFLMFPR